MENVVEAYPLQWPVGVERAEEVHWSRFGTWRNPVTIAVGRDGVLEELRMLGATDPIISSNLKLRKDGLPYSSQKQPEDTGVAVYFIYEGEQRVLACDAWHRIGDNLRAIEKTINALRGIDRWGVSEILQRTFTGFKALPEDATHRKWWVVLMIEQDATVDEIKSAYRRMARTKHPDRGGNRAQWDELRRAYEEAMAQ